MALYNEKTMANLFSSSDKHLHISKAIEVVHSSSSSLARFGCNFQSQLATLDMLSCNLFADLVGDTAKIVAAIPAEGYTAVAW